MGMFDSVMVACPSCGKAVEFQSKESACNMDVFSLDNAPAEIIRDIANSPEYCRHCDSWFALIDPDYPPGPSPRPTLRAAKVKTPDNPTIHRTQTFLRWWPDDHRFSYDDLTDGPHEPAASDV